MEPRLGLHELLHVFSFLEARDLLCAAQVDKLFWNILEYPSWACLGSQAFPVWNEVSSTKELWRQLCLRCWFSCKAPQMTLGTQTWKQHYLCQSELEFRMECGRPEKDFIRKAIAGHKGGIDELAYVSHSECRFDGREKSVVCTVSSDSTVRAWDVQEGTEIWSSPVQPAPLVSLVTFPRLQLVVTVDRLGLIKVWKAENGREWASSLPTYSSALQACDHPEGPFLLVASAEGILYALTVPRLRLLSRTAVLPGSPPASSALLPASGCSLRPRTQTWAQRACWAAGETARLTAMHRNHGSGQLAITTYELVAKQSQEGVAVVDSMTPPHLMKAHGSQVILLVSGLELVPFTIQGLQLAAFQDHQKPITALWVDQSRVLTASFDLSLRVYGWSKENPLPVLKSCYHLLGGLHRWASGFTHVESDSVSIVGVEARNAGTSILRSYCFNLRRGSDDCVT